MSNGNNMRDSVITFFKGDLFVTAAFSISGSEVAKALFLGIIGGIGSLFAKALWKKIVELIKKNK